MHYTSTSLHNYRYKQKVDWACWIWHLGLMPEPPHRSNWQSTMIFHEYLKVWISFYPLGMRTILVLPHPLTKANKEMALELSRKWFMLPEWADKTLYYAWRALLNWSEYERVKNKSTLKELIVRSLNCSIVYYWGTTISYNNNWPAISWSANNRPI